jgi:hypothetical protein
MNWILEHLERLSTFTGDIAWGVATSPPVLILLGAIAVAAFAVAHVPLVERFFPEVIPFTKAALIAQLVASSALIFLLGFNVAQNRDETERLKNDLAWSEHQIEIQTRMADSADQLKREADARAANAEGQLSEYKKKFGDNPSDPPPGVLEWMRSLQQHPERRAGAGAEQPQRGVVARVRATGGRRQ